MVTRKEVNINWFEYNNIVGVIGNCSGKGSPLEYVNGHEYWSTARMAALKRPILRDRVLWQQTLSFIIFVGRILFLIAVFLPCFDHKS